MTDPIEAIAVALCETALGGKRCPCKESGKFNCRDEHPGRCATAALAALSETHLIVPLDGLEPVAWAQLGGESGLLHALSPVKHSATPTPLYTLEGIKP